MHVKFAVIIALFALSLCKSIGKELSSILKYSDEDKNSIDHLIQMEKINNDKKLTEDKKIDISFKGSSVEVKVEVVRRFLVVLMNNKIPIYYSVRLYCTDRACTRRPTTISL